ncbi:MAG: cell division protein ZapE [Rhodospirillaceae bacterium]|nr:cell division protein ZapE [Rhodospirillaceae bacterium]|tara:strand:- start:13663 stop:14760 length:1098 start_codon:yes stop_codon:yes gene_type:complete
MNSPIEQYQRYIDGETISNDLSQKSAIDALQQVYEALTTSTKNKKSWKKILGVCPNISSSPVRGVYLWGDVGRGKTFLMDLFYNSLPFEEKLREHFHRFMGNVHNALKNINAEQDPLQLVADKLAKQTRVICFDEFFVSDIADAMILGTLFEALFQRGITLVTTSNIKPDDLYKDGLQRQRFLKAISLVKQNTQIIKLEGSIDYRLRLLERADVYQYPLGKLADKKLAKYFSSFASGIGRENLEINILGRKIRALREAQDVVWFDFYQVCDGPRSHNDYIELARCYQTVLISNVPQLTKEQENQCRRFISLVDEFYDRRVKLILSAEKELNNLYIGEKLVSEFRRTKSRLEEMQSHDYLAQAHLP